MSTESRRKKLIVHNKDGRYLGIWYFLLKKQNPKSSSACIYLFFLDFFVWLFFFPYFASSTCAKSWVCDFQDQQGGVGALGQQPPEQHGDGAAVLRAAALEQHRLRQLPAQPAPRRHQGQQLQRHLRAQPRGQLRQQQEHRQALQDRYSSLGPGSGGSAGWVWLMVGGSVHPIPSAHTQHLQTRP